MPEVVVFICVALELWGSVHSLLGSGNKIEFSSKYIFQFQEGNKDIVILEYKELGVMNKHKSDVVVQDKVKISAFAKWFVLDKSVTHPISSVRHF